MKLNRHIRVGFFVSLLTFAVFCAPSTQAEDDPLPILNPINNQPVTNGPLTPPANLPTQPEGPLIPVVPAAPVAPVANDPGVPVMPVNQPIANNPAPPVAQNPEQPTSPCEVEFYKVNPKAPATYRYFSDKPVTKLDKLTRPVEDATRAARDRVLGVLLSTKKFLPIFASDNDALEKAAALARSYYPNRILPTDATSFVVPNIQAEIAAHIALVKKYPGDIQNMIDTEATLDLNIADLEEALPEFRRLRAKNPASQKSFSVHMRQLRGRASITHDFASPESLQTALQALKTRHSDLVSLRATETDSFRYRARAQALSIEQLETYRNELLAQAAQDKHDKVQTPQALINLVGQIQDAIGGPNGKVPTQYLPPLATFQGIQWEKLRKGGQALSQMSQKGLQDLGLLTQDGNGNLVPVVGQGGGADIGQGIQQAIQNLSPDQKTYFQSRYQRINRAIFNWKTGAWSIGAGMVLNGISPHWPQYIAQIPSDLLNLYFNRRSTLRDRIAKAPDENTYDTLLMEYLQSKYSKDFTLDFDKGKNAVFVTDKKTGQMTINPTIKADIDSLQKAHNTFLAQTYLENDEKSQLRDYANANVVGSDSWIQATAKLTDDKQFAAQALLLIKTEYPKTMTDPNAIKQINAILATTDQNKQWSLVNSFSSQYPTQGTDLQNLLQQHWNYKDNNFYWNGYTNTTTQTGQQVPGNPNTPIGNNGGIPVLPPIIQTGPQQPGQTLPPFHILQ